jgi:hypothetical protein
MLLGQSRGFGFNPFSAIKTAAKDVYSVARDPRAQALVAAGGQAYAPGATSQVMQATHSIQDNIRNARRFLNPQGQVVMVPAGQAPPPGSTPDGGGSPDGGELPVQNSHMLVYAAVGGGLLLLLLLMKK